MKLTLSWLKKYLETDASAHAIAEKLTALGLEVEQVVDRGKVLAPFVIAHIVEATQHPNADRLKLCSVTDGTKNYQVVCGAPNARTGLKIVLARVGDVIPRDGVALKAGSIRGVESQAMCCSADELNLQHDRADGIIELPDDAPVGKNYAAWAGLDDVTFELKLTPNRPDCAGVYGIARDLAAAGLGTLKPLARANVQGNFPCPVSVMLETEAAPHFALRLVRGVHNGPSPAWLQRLLRDIGLRPISALVDITNFFTFAYARPLHVFDAKKVQGNLRVHAAAGGETLAALNDKTYTLQPGMIAISDDTGVISLAGVVGGATTGCDDTTTDVLIEAAFFNPARTAQTGRELGVVSDARWRFERGIDPHFTEAGLDLATQMVVDVCGQNNTQISHMVVAGAAPDHTRSYVLPHTYGAQLMGVDVPITEQAEILSRLGFVLWEKKNAWDVGVPSWRPDVMGKADLVEEIVRVKGFDMIPATSLPRPQATTPAALNILQKRTQVARRVLAGAGLMEVVTLSFMAGDVAKHFGWHDLSQKIVNPIAADLDVLRPSLLPNVVGVAARNAARGLPHGAWFEVGPVFSGGKPGQQEVAAACVWAGATPRHWQGQKVFDVFDAKAMALHVLVQLGLNPASVMWDISQIPSHFHPTRSVALKLGPAVLAHVGELHPTVLTLMDAAPRMVGAEIFVGRLPPPKNTSTHRGGLTLSALQPVARDFAFVLEADVPAATLLKAIKGADALIAGADVFDVYTGDKLPQGKKSLAVAVVLQPTTQTLTETDIDAISQKIIAAAAKAGAVIRG